jgi:hypothetical protein
MIALGRFLVRAGSFSAGGCLDVAPGARRMRCAAGASLRVPGAIPPAARAPMLR